MIVFNLSCAHEHTFEGWFASGDAFQQQSLQGMVCCPVCGSHEISRRPSSPHVRRSSPVSEPTTPPTEVSLEALLEGLRELLEAAEDVGEDFAAEARRIHYDEVEVRSIRGVTTLEEAGELLEEGIAVLPLAIASKKDMH